MGDWNYTIYASESDCLADAPDPYRSLMHFLHFISIPLYTLSIYVLMFKTPNSLKKYRKYLLWHTTGNLVFEVYLSIFYLPVTYFPHLVIRGTGVLKYFNISGLLQFYFLATAMIHTTLSVMEMFKYRYNVTFIEPSFNKKFLNNAVIIYWVTAIVMILLGFFVIQLKIQNQVYYKMNLWVSFPNIPVAILCYTSVVSPPADALSFKFFLGVAVLSFIAAIVIVPNTTLAIWARLEQMSNKTSKKTVELHKMLLISLFIQTAIHGIMLAAPLVAFGYVILFSDNDFAQFLFLLFSFHGSVSTFAMIVFTKPIRVGVVSILSHLVPCTDKFKKIPLGNNDSTQDAKSNLFINRKTNY